MDIEKLDIKDGDILLVSNYTDIGQVERLVTKLRDDMGRKNIMVIVGMSVKVLSEEMMNKHGWEKKRTSDSKRPRKTQTSRKRTGTKKKNKS